MEGGTRPPPPPPPPPPEYEYTAIMRSKIQRFKPIWRILLISNLALGAYMFAMARKKNVRIGDNKPANKVVEDSTKKDVEDSTSSVESSFDLTIGESVPDSEIATLPAMPPPKVKDVIPEDQQRELFKWILEEKRKVKPKDAEEKKRIDEEKAILKQFIQAESLPDL